MIDTCPLRWPTGWPRTKEPQRSRFDTKLADARRGLAEEIRLLGGDQIALSTNMIVGASGRVLSGQAQPRDTGVALYFVRKGKPMAIACDRWTSVADNIQAIRLSIEALRGLDRWGASAALERAVSAFEQLPPPRSCWDVLGLGQGATREQIERAFRDRAKRAHPDAGGSTAAMAELNKARDEALGSLVA